MIEWRLEAYLRCHPVPNLITLPIPPFVIHFRAGIENEEVDTADGYENTIAALICSCDQHVIMVHIVWGNSCLSRTSWSIICLVYICINDCTCLHEPVLYFELRRDSLLG